MKTTIKAMIAGTAAVMALTAFAPIAAQARGGQQLQQQKNTDRNIAIGSAALGVLGLLDHNSTLGILGIAGAAVAGSQYENDQHIQSNRDAHRQYFYRSDRGGYYGNVDNGNRFNNNGNDGNNGNQSHYHVGEY